MLIIYNFLHMCTPFITLGFDIAQIFGLFCLFISAGRMRTWVIGDSIACPNKHCAWRNQWFSQKWVRLANTILQVLFIVGERIKKIHQCKPEISLFGKPMCLDEGGHRYLFGHKSNITCNVWYYVVIFGNEFQNEK